MVPKTVRYVMPVPEGAGAAKGKKGGKKKKKK
jgi:hypothetical protein